MNKKNKVVVAFLAMVILFQSGCSRREPDVIWSGEQKVSSGKPGTKEIADGGAAGQTDSGGTAEKETQQTLICVDVCGAVVSPGVYLLEPGARVYEAVEMAGGLTADADRNAVNQAELLKDGTQIRILSLEEAEKRQEMQEAAGMVNLNTADIAALCTLPGIGEARAGDIIAYREKNGGFQDVEEIMNVSGIKEATFDKIKDKIVAE